MKRKNGISIYPNDESIENIKEYLKLAGQLNYQYVFNSIHMPEFSKEQMLNFLKEISMIVHENNMKIVSDIRGSFLEEIDNDKNLKKTFQELNLDCIRLDFEMNEKSLDILKANDIREVFVNASTLDEETIKEYKSLCDKKGLILKACHNYYPRPETGLSREFYLRQNTLFTKYNVDVFTFIPSSDKPRGPIYEGLPTIEDHRNMDFSTACLELDSSLQAENILIGDGMADENKLKELQGISLNKNVLLRVKIFDKENFESLLNRWHPIRYDSGQYQLRLDGIRQVGSHSGKDIRPNNTVERSKGSVTIDNKLYKRYEGESQIIKSDLSKDYRVNVVGEIIRADLDKLDYIDHRYTVKFLEAEDEKSAF